MKPSKAFALDLHGCWRAVRLDAAADMGADVIKVEDPDGGDPMRIMGPPFLPDGESAYFLAINRNKKSVALDLARERGREVFYDLVRQSDVVWENFRPGIMERLGLAYSKLWSLNQRIIVCSVSAYGQDGPYRDWPAFDLALQAMGGAMSVTGEAGGRPVRMGLPMADLAGGCPWRRRRALPPGAHGRGRSYRPVAARLSGVAPHLHRAVLLDERPRADAARLGPRLGGAVLGASDARWPPDRRDLRREILAALLPRGRSSGMGARHAIRVQPRPGPPPRRADAARRSGVSHAHHPGMARAPPGRQRAGDADPQRRPRAVRPASAPARHGRRDEPSAARQDADARHPGQDRRRDGPGRDAAAAPGRAHQRDPGPPQVLEREDAELHATGAIA